MTMTEAEEETWRAAQRVQVSGYLHTEGLIHGAVGESPAWSLAPCVSIWAVESIEAPGSVGWWVICGDLPTDYCSARNCRRPRLAMKKIAEEWRNSVLISEPSDTTLGDTRLPASLAPLLAKRAQLLLDWVNDPSLWPD